MAAGPDLKYAPACSCGHESVRHDPLCHYPHYVQGFFDAICLQVGKHLYLEHLDGRCARCGRDESGTLGS